MKIMLKVTTILLLIINITLSLETSAVTQIIESRSNPSDKNNAAGNGGSFDVQQPTAVVGIKDTNGLSGLLRKARQSRCIRCYDDSQNPKSTDTTRYLDDGGRRYSSTRYYTTGTGSTSTGLGASSVGHHGSGYAASRIDDRYNNWYYPTERYDRNDDRARFYEDRYPPADRNSIIDRYHERDNRYPNVGDRYPDRYPDTGNRNDDRYYSRTYDRYDPRLTPTYYDRYDIRQQPPLVVDNRGYGGAGGGSDRYPSTDRYNDRDRGYDRNRGGYDSRQQYDREVYDRYPPRVIGYDYRNYRPVDETYRGQSGFDNSGRGYYFANERPNELYPHPHQPPPPPPYLYSPTSTPGQPYLPNSQSPPRPLYQSTNGSSVSGLNNGPNSSSSTGSGSSTNSGDYNNNRPSRPDDSNNKDNGYAGGWGYPNDRDKSGYRGNNNGDNRDKDAQSSAYGGGGRQRPSLTGSYLLDRESNNIPKMAVQNPITSTTTDVNNHQSQNTDQNTENGGNLKLNNNDQKTTDDRQP